MTIATIESIAVGRSGLPEIPSPANVTKNVAPPPPSPQPPRAPKSAAKDVGEDKAREERLRERTRAIVFPLAATVLFLFLWQVYSQREGVTLPGPSAVWRDSRQMILHPWFDNGANDKGLGWQILASLERVAIGYGGAAAVGIFAGLLLGRVRGLQQAFDPLMQVFRTVPPLAWLPLSLAIFAQSEPAAIWVIFVTAIWPIVINTSVGVMNMPKDYENVAQVYEIKGWRYLSLVLLPAVAPYMLTGLRVAVGMAWLGIVASEMLTGGVGIGFFIWDAWNSGRVSDIIVALVWVGGTGLALDRLVALVAKLLGTSAN
jgi:nitrate/nitrite transport system permease protein